MIRNIWFEFREFALRGSFVEIAIGIFVGAGFTPVASSLITDIVMPFVALLFGNVDMVDKFLVLKEGAKPAPYITLEAAKKAGAITVSYGVFINTLLTFLTITWVAFWVVKLINRMKKSVETTVNIKDQSTKTCPDCLSIVPAGAKRCSQCTSFFEVGQNNQFS